MELPRVLHTVGVVGAGTMGQGIAQVCATSGYDVWLYDQSISAAEKAFLGIRTSLEALLAKGKIDKDGVGKALESIRVSNDLSAKNADIVIEAIVERLEIKQRLFAVLESAMGTSCLLATNTSSLSVSQIGSGLRDKSRFGGLHFFNPAPVMRLVEVVSTPFTSQNTVGQFKSFCVSLGKDPVSAQDSPGFIVNRVARLFYVEALNLLEEGVADVESVDRLMRSAGFRMGPFELMDLIGIDTNFAVTSSLYNAFYQEPRFRPSRIQQQKVDTGALGRKTGKGFYDYNKGDQKGS